MAMHDPHFSEESDSSSEAESDEPKMYRVLIHNDHYTTMEFVVNILMNIFHKPAAEATKIMMDVHRGGRGVCGVFIYDIAVTKVSQVHQLARQNKFPLRCSYEEA
ncbi:MAG: ATP-dependent Clp protease adapter protein ClpS [Syntrophaceae bacterium PtaU1.Bin231]|nr:MAG: ATP-dependent Clp protease adapter protein ClpS [Syntrophaceae bacterium PtaU1.Bin231]HOG15900.1 ATP-dependent Clp protease adaptor ClpS [Syntrophales bacterium]